MISDIMIPLINKYLSAKVFSYDIIYEDIEKGKRT